MLDLKKAAALIMALCMGLPFTAGAAADSRADMKTGNVVLSIQISDLRGNPVPNLAVTVTPAFPDAVVSANDPRLPAKTDAYGGLRLNVTPGAYTVRVSDPKQDWILGGDAPSHDYEVAVEKPKQDYDYDFIDLIWDQTTPDEFSKTVSDKVVFHLVDPDGNPADNRAVYLDYQVNEHKRDFGKVAGGYSDKNGVYTYLKPLDRKITLFVYGTDFSQHELTLPALSTLPDVDYIKVEVPPNNKTNPGIGMAD